MPPDLRWQDCGSSHLGKAAWWEEDGVGKLAITFPRAGKTAVYTGVPRGVYESMMNAPSRGVYHAKNVRLVFPFDYV